MEAEPAAVSAPVVGGKQLFQNAVAELEQVNGPALVVLVPHDQLRDAVAVQIRHADDLVASGILDDPPLEEVNRQWRRIERYWGEQIRYIY